jgi:hypothetical protein
MNEICLFEEEVMLEYALADLQDINDTEYVNEGVLSNIWEKVKKFFKAIKDFVVKYLKKFRDLFKKKNDTKVTPADVKACEETLKDPKSYTDSKDADNDEEDDVEDTQSSNTSTSSTSSNTSSTYTHTTTSEPAATPVDDAPKKSKFIGAKIKRRKRLDRNKKFEIVVDNASWFDGKIDNIFDIKLYNDIINKGYESISKVDDSYRDTVNKFFKAPDRDAAVALLNTIKEEFEESKQAVANRNPTTMTLDMDYVSKHFKDIAEFANGKFIARGTENATHIIETRIKELESHLNTTIKNLEGKFKDQPNADLAHQALTGLLSVVSEVNRGMLNVFTTQIKNTNKTATEIYNYVKYFADYRRAAMKEAVAELDEYYAEEFMNEDCTDLDSNLDDTCLNEYTSGLEDVEELVMEQYTALVNDENSVLNESVTDTYIKSVTKSFMRLINQFNKDFLHDLQDILTSENIKHIKAAAASGRYNKKFKVYTLNGDPLFSHINPITTVKGMAKGIINTVKVVAKSIVGSRKDVLSDKIYNEIVKDSAIDTMDIGHEYIAKNIDRIIDFLNWDWSKLQRLSTGYQDALLQFSHLDYTTIGFGKYLPDAGKSFVKIEVGAIRAANHTVYKQFEAIRRNMTAAHNICKFLLSQKVSKTEAFDIDDIIDMEVY